MQTRNRQGLFYVVTICALISAVLVCAEILVRLLFPFNTPDTIRQYSIRYVRSICSTNRVRPLGHMMQESDSKALGARSENEPIKRYFINEAGYRGHSFAPVKLEGTIRIVILGGSSVFDANGKDISPEEGRDWPHLVERFLRDMGHSNVEVVNAGVPGHATFDSLGRLYSQLWIYKPDYVLLYNCWNDLKYFRKVTPEKPLITHYEPMKENPFTTYQGLLDRVSCHSQLYVKLRNRYYMWKYPAGNEGLLPEGEYLDTYSSHAVKQYRLNVQLIVD